MPRSATDATRFTSTTPHASAKPPHASNLGSSGVPLPQRTPGPAGETPQERVRRLREAASRARDAKLSTFDRLIIRGRVWADRAHRFTALSLIGLTGIAGVVTVYVIGDMVIYNRRKRREYFAEQQALHAAALHDAQKAIRHGTASQEQQALLDSEAIQTEVLEAKKAAKRPKILARTKEWLFSGLKREEEGDDFGSSERRLGYEAMSEEDDVLGERESDILRAIDEKKLEVKEKAKRVLEREKELQRSGGRLDRIGGPNNPSSEASKAEAPKSGGGWTAFMSRR